MDKLRLLDEAYLPLVTKPSRYTGSFLHAARKDPAQARVRLLLCFPDLYEIGMSYLGLKILYHIINGRPDGVAELCFTPWSDMEHLRAGAAALFARVATGPGVRPDRVLAPVRALVHQRAYDDRSGADAAPHQGSPRRRSDRDRGRTLHRESGAVGPVHRRLRDRRRGRGDPGALRPHGGAPGDAHAARRGDPPDGRRRRRLRAGALCRGHEPVRVHRA